MMKLGGGLVSPRNRGNSNISSSETKLKETKKLSPETTKESKNTTIKGNKTPDNTAKRTMTK